MMCVARLHLLMEHSTPLKGKVARFGWVLFVLAVPMLDASDPQQNPPTDQGPAALKKLSLEQLSQIEVTTASKEPSKPSGPRRRST